MQPIFLVMGTPASGKSTVCRALAQRFKQGLYLPVDDLRLRVVAGRADVGLEISPALLQQLRLAHEAASSMARIYSDAGFAVAIDDDWFGSTPDADYNRKIGRRMQRVLLLPSLEATLERLRSRNQGDSSWLEQAVRLAHQAIAAHPKKGWLVVDSTHLSVEQTIDQILEQTSRQNLIG